MVTRRERVILDLESNLPEGMLRGAAATKVQRMELDRLSTSSVQTGRAQQAMSRDVDKATTSVDKSDKSINQLTGRLSLLADVVAILGPGLVPLATVAVPAVTGLAAQLGFATAGAAGFMVAIQGVGDALEAMNTARLEPTAENLAKARVEMEKLSPAGQDLVGQLYGLRDEWRRLRDVSQGALFPGVMSALDDLETRLPDVERILVNVNTAVGEMLADGAESLASPRWDSFFDFIATDAPPAIASMGRALGDVAHAMTVMWRAFDPLNDDFSIWLEDSANSLDEWAKGLSKTEGFQEFVDYIRETGPQVADTLGSVALAVIRIGEAAAPLGGPVLAALEGVADAVSAIAGSDAGPAIMTTVTALALLRRGMATFDRVSATSWAQNVKGAETFGQRIAAARSPLLKTSAAMAGIAIASSDTAQGFGLANTASGALLGTMAGPWGAAIGGAVGLMLDLTSSTDGFKVNADSLTATLNQQTGALTANTTAYAANELESQGVLQSAKELGLSLSDVTQASLGNEDALARVTGALERTKSGFYDSNNMLKISTAELYEFRKRSEGVTGAIATMSGEVDAGQTRIRRMADATDAGTAAYSRAETAAQDFATAVSRLNSVLSGRAAMRDYEAAIDDFTKSLKENGRTFDINTEKGRNNQAALDNIATTAVKVAEGMKGAARQRFLTAAIADLREAADKWDVPKSQTRDLIRLLKEANDTPVRPTVDTGGVLSAIQIIRKALKDIPDESVIVRVTRSGTGAVSPGLGPVGSADGSTVPKSGRPYADRFHYLLADGEEVISNRFGQADRHRALLKRINANRLADGGTAGGDKTKRKRAFDFAPEVGPSPSELYDMLRAAETQADAASDQAQAARIALSAAEDQQKAAEKGEEVAKQNLTAAEQMRDSLRDSVASQFSGSLLGGGLAGLSQTLNRDINGGASMAATLRALADAGLDTTGPSAGLYRELAASEDQQTANELLAAGPEAIAMFERQIAERDAINAQRAAEVSERTFGPMVAAAQAAYDVAAAQLAIAQTDSLRAEQRATAVSNQVGELQNQVGQLAGDLASAINSTVRGGRR